MGRQVGINKGKTEELSCDRKMVLSSEPELKEYGNNRDHDVGGCC